MRKLIVVLQLWVIMTLFTNIATAQSPGTIQGKIIDKATDTPLVGANVQLEGTLLGASAGLKGFFEIRRVPPGTYTLKVSMIGYRSVQKTGVKVEPGQITEVSVELEETVIDMNPVVVTASRRKQELSISPHSITVVPEADLQQRTPLRLDDALKTVSGLHFIENHVSIRGSSGYTRGVGSRVLLLIDGIPMMISDTNEINWNLLPVMEIEQIEVIKGAGSALYGSNALGGIINVITKQPSASGRLGLRFILGGYDEPYQNQWQEYWQFKWTDRLLHYDRYDISYSQQLGNLGFRLYFGNHTSTGYRQDGHFKRYNASGKLTYRFGDASQVTLYGGWSYENRGEFVEWASYNRPLSSSYWSRNKRVRINTFDIYTQYWKPLSSKAALKLRASFISSLFGDQYKRATDYYPAQGIGSEIQMYWLPHPAHNLTFGVEYKIDGGHTKHIGDRTGYTLAPYLQDEWNILKNLTLTAGLRYDRYKVEGSVGSQDTSLIKEKVFEKFQIKGFTQYDEGHYNPKLGINFKPFQSTVLRFSAGSAFRAASVTERYMLTKVLAYIMVPNEDLKAETTWAIDFGIQQQIMKDCFIDMAVFHNDYYNLIEPMPEMLDNFVTVVQFRNVIRARIKGLEASIKGSWWKNHLGLQASYTYMSARDIHDHVPLAYRPARLALIIPSIRFDPVEFQAEYRYASRIDTVKLYSMDPRVPMKVLDLRLLFRWKALLFTVSLNNALNYNYTQLERNLGEIRNLSVALMANFSMEELF